MTEKRIQELVTAKQEIERKYPITIRVRLFHRGAFIGGGGEIAILAFIFGAIAGGFLSEIDKDLWTKAKEFCKRVYDSHKARSDDSRSTILAVFEYKDYQITAFLEVDQDIREQLERVYLGDPLGYFWEGISIQLAEVIRMVDENSDYIATAKAFGLGLSPEEPTWILTKYAEKMDVDKYVEPQRRRKRHRGPKKQ